MRFDIRETALENGLRIVHAHVPANEAYIAAHVNAGPLFEPDNLLGITYFCMHTLYNGTGKRPSREAIYAETDKMGGYRESQTTKQWAKLGQRVVLDDFEQALDLFADLLHSARMDDNDIEKSKEVVIGQIKRENDDPMPQLAEQLKQTIFEGSELAKPVLGTEETISSFTPEQVRGFYKEFFNPANTTLIIAGPHDFSELTDKVQKYFAPFVGRERKEMPVIKKPVNAPREANIGREMGSVLIDIARLAPDASHEDAYALRVLDKALNTSVCGRLVNEESIAHNCWTTYNDYSNLFGWLLVHASCSPENYQRVKKVIVDELERFRRGDFFDGDVRDKIEYLKKSFVFNNGLTSQVGNTMFKFNTTGNVYEINDYLANLEKVTPEAVREAAAKHMSVDDITVVSVGNIKKA